MEICCTFVVVIKQQTSLTIKIQSDENNQQQHQTGRALY